MINNRQNGRRRGRGGGGGGGGQRQGGGGQGPRDSGNRIDSRARGNASQLLEKYRNMARDAQLSGDRVQTEYYLQFADHYFRVLADQRGRFEERGEQQGRRPRDDFDAFDQFDGDDFDDEVEARGDDRGDGARNENGRSEGQRYDGQRSDGGRVNARERGYDEGGRGNNSGGGERGPRQVPVANDLDAADEQPGDDAGERAAAPAAEQEGIADRLPPSFGFAVEGERASEGEPVERTPRPRRRRAAGSEAGPTS